jgi:peptidyl-prolyl cis-trans isomerase D
MLSTIRDKTQGIIATFILFLVVVPFALWGINSYFESGSKLNVATVDGTDISQVAYRRALDQLRGRVNPKAFDNPQFKQLILDRLIGQTLLSQDAEKQGYRISDAQLARIIQSLPNFQRDGRFDSAMYQAVLRGQGVSPQQFEENLRDEILTRQIETGLSASGFVTKADIADIVRLMSQERETAYAVIDTRTLMAKTTVNAKEIENYYSSHPETFQIPEQVRIDYLTLSAADLDKNDQPTEDELKKAYADEAARYVMPEKRRASHILISLPANATAKQDKEALEKIQDIARQIHAGANFAAMAKKYSMDSATAAEGGDLGEVRRGVLPKGLEEAVDALKPGEVSKPVRSQYGYHLVKLTALTPEKRRPFAEVRNDLIKLVQRNKGENKFFDLSEKFRNIVYEQPDSLVPAAKALGLKIQKSDWFSRSGGPGIAANPKVVQAAFEPDVLSQARNSDAIDISDDVLMAVRVVDHRPVGRKPLAQVRAEIERILKQERAQEAAHKLGEEWIHALKAGGSLEALARKRGFKYQPAKYVTRGKSPGIDPRVVEAAFRVPRPENGKPVYDLVDLGDQGFAVLALKDVREASGKAEAGLREQAKSMLTPRRTSDTYADYQAGLKEKAKIKIYSDQL